MSNSGATVAGRHPVEFTGGADGKTMHALAGPEELGPPVKPAPRVLMGMPAYIGVVPAAMQAMFNFASAVPGRCCTPKVLPFSHHCGSFNAIYCTALNARREMGLTHLCVHHQDVVPEPNYVDIALDVMDRDGLDLLAAVVPIKGEEGMTSVAALDRDTLHTRRLSRKECLELPPTFRSEDLRRLGWKNHLLLPVAGLFFLRITDDAKLFDGRGNSRLWFESPSRILRDMNGTYVSAVWDEGWNFSLQAYLAGMTVAATTEIALNHVGGGAWSNEEWKPRDPWETDACQTDYTWALGKCPRSLYGDKKEKSVTLVGPDGKAVTP